MKKYNEMNKHEQAAFRAIKKEFNWLVGEWYNCFQDGYEEDIPTLEEAKDYVYREAMGHNPKEIRFAGEEFCRGIVDMLFAKDEDADELWGVELQPAVLNEHGCVDCKGCPLTECVHRNCMRRNPEEIGGLGECPRLSIKETITNTTKEKKEDKEMTREKARAYILNHYTVKEMREHLKDAGVKGVSRAKKEELVEMMLDMEEQKDANRGNTVTISKVNMYAFTGMFIGEFEAEVQDGKILVSTASRGELMFDLNTGKEVCDEAKARWANRVEAV